MKNLTKVVCGVYLIKNNITRRVRIGSSQDCHRRWSNYLANLRNGRGNKKMQKDYNNYGEQSFEFIIIDECKVRDLYIREAYWMEEYSDCISNGYNSNRVRKKEKYFRTGLTAKKHKEKYREVMSGESNPNCIKLNQNKANEILWLKENTELTYKQIAEMYNIATTLVGRIGKDRWKNSIAIRPSWFDESEVM